MEQLRLEPISGVNGTVNVPGSKSLSNQRTSSWQHLQKVKRT